MNRSILFILKVESLERDDRVRKQALSLSKKGCDVRFLVNFDHNKSCNGYTSYGIKYESVSIRTRDFFKPSAMILMKAFEFWLRVIWRVKSKDLLVIHEEYTFMIGVMTNKNFIWDLHEFPSKFNNLLGKIVLKVVEKKSHKIIHANKERLNICFEKRLFSDRKKHRIINNYPDKEFFKRSSNDISDLRVVHWLQPYKFIYLQGLFAEGRFPYNTVKSILINIAALPIKVLIIGSYEEESMQKLKAEFGDLFNEKVCFIGPIDQLEIPIYLSKCLFTVVLYKSNSINNLYCEPNRLYQAIALQIPVIVGSNPTLKNIVKNYEKAIILDDDGSNLSSLDKAICQMLESKYCNYLEQSMYKREPIVGDKFIWNDEYVHEVFND